MAEEQRLALTDRSGIAQMRALDAKIAIYMQLYRELVQNQVEALQRISYPAFDARIVVVAIPTEEKSAPSLKIYIGLGLLIGVLFGLVCIFIKEYKYR